MSVQDVITDYKELAIQVLEEMEEVKRCDYHSDYIYRTYRYDEKELYAIATAKIKELRKGDRIDYSLFHDEIKTVLEESGDSSDCPICSANIDKIMRE